MAGSSTEGIEGTPKGAPYVLRRTLEIWTAAAAGLVAVVVIVESLTHDIGWNEAGPGSGYFPFRLGLLLFAAAIVRVLQTVRGAGSASRASHASGPAGTLASGPVGPASGPAVFVTREELRRSLSVFWPTAALVVAMFPLGCYVPSGVYLAWMMRRHGGHGWLLSVAYGAAVMVAFFLIFDLWFKVPLAKGPLEALFRIY
jgi:hypothetical protein